MPTPIEREWWEELRDECEDAESLYGLIEDIVPEAQRREREEIVKIVEGMKTCAIDIKESYPEYSRGATAVCNDIINAIKEKK